MADYVGQIVAALRSDPLIDEIGLLLDMPPPAATAAAPDGPGTHNITVVAEHKLGIAVWALKPMFKYAMPLFMELMAKLRRLHPGHLEEGRSLQPGSDVAGIAAEAVSLSSAILIVKGDIPIVHNFRKELLQAGVLELEAELVFLSMLFSRHPKSPSAWEHRRWCLRRLAQQRRGYEEGDAEAVEIPAASIAIEAELCRRSAEAYPKNYYAWMHRLWLLPQMSDEQIEEEHVFVHGWMYAHTSDHSACSHAAQVVLEALRRRRRRRRLSCGEDEGEDKERGMREALAVLDAAQRRSRELVVARPGSESLWYLRRLLWTALLDVLGRYASTIGASEAAHEPCMYEEDLARLDRVICTALNSDEAVSINGLGDISWSVDRDAPSPQSITHILLRLVVGEAGLVASQAAPGAEVLWSRERQRDLALRYLAHVISQVLKFGESYAPLQPILSELHTSLTALADSISITAQYKARWLDLAR